MATTLRTRPETKSQVVKEAAAKKQTKKVSAKKEKAKKPTIRTLVEAFCDHVLKAKVKRHPKFKIARTVDDLRYFGISTKVGMMEIGIVANGQLRSRWGDSEFARFIKPKKGKPFVLLNGDDISRGTQTALRRAFDREGIRRIIIPHEAIAAAGIKMNTIQPMAINEDTYEKVEHIVDRWEDLPTDKKWIRRRGYFTKTQLRKEKWVMPYGGGPVPGHFLHWHHAIKDHGYYGDLKRKRPKSEDGKFHYFEMDHSLGSSVFSALTEDGGNKRQVFLSSFDEQESPPLYFLCQMPNDKKTRGITSVAEALEQLKPPEVLTAEFNGLDTPRQGDLFAVEAADVNPFEISVDYTYHRGIPEIYRIDVPSEAQIFGTNHTATEVVRVNPGQKDEEVYVKGSMVHRPNMTARQWDTLRRPDHAARQLGDGKTWYRCFKNTVPQIQLAGRPLQSRAWSVSGRVD